MNKLINFLCILLAIPILISCSEDINPRGLEDTAVETTKQDQVVNTNLLSSESEESGQDQQTGKSEPVFTPDYISAEDLHQRFLQDTIPFIFDVRGKNSFEQSHIRTALSMPYGGIEDSDLAYVTSLNKNSEIVTYCGCPRHLSTLAAADLMGRGYSNIKVLYEGFWHWQEQQYPTVESSTTTAYTTVVKFQGELVENHHPASGVDLFLQHVKSGQLEAVRTDNQGRFNLEFHVYGYQADDQFNLIVENVVNPPYLQLSADPDTTTVVEVDL